MYCWANLTRMVIYVCDKREDFVNQAKQDENTVEMES